MIVMNNKDRLPEGDDGRVIADMSGVERQPMLFPDLSGIRKTKENSEGPEGTGSINVAHGPEQIDNEGRRAMIGGALSAMLLVGGIMFAAFALLILLIGHLA